MASFSSNCDFFFFKLSNCFIKIVPLKLANACPPEAAAVHAVEEAKHRTKFASVLAFLHTFMTLDRRCFFCSTLLLIEMLMLLLAILKGSTSNREMWGSVCQGRHVTTNGEALVPVPFGTMFIRLCHTSKCNYLLQNMSLYMREMDRETERESIGHEKEEWEERKNEEGRRRWERRWWYHDIDDYRHTLPLSLDALLSVCVIKEKEKRALKKRKKNEHRHLSITVDKKSILNWSRREERSSFFVQYAHAHTIRNNLRDTTHSLA